MQWTKKDFRKYPDVFIPHVDVRKSSKRVITMEKCVGTKIVESKDTEACKVLVDVIA